MHPDPPFGELLIRCETARVRGSNLGGRNRVAMADLRELVAGLGHTGVWTYIQSGNVLFRAKDAGAGTSALAEEMTAAVAAQYPECLCAHSRLCAHSCRWRAR